MRKRFIIDALLLLIIIISMFYNVTGNLLHETIGLILLVIVIVHLIINKKVIMNFLNNLNNKNYIVDIGLIVFLIITLITGIIISNSVFSFLNIGNSEVMVLIHKISSYIMFLCFIIHTLLHLDALSLYCSKLFNINKKYTKTSLLIILTIVTIISLKNLFTSFIKKEEINTSDNEDKKIDESEENIIEDPPTLNEYLSTKHCSGCHNHCVLTAIKCGRGQQSYEQAKEEYYNEYSNSMSFVDDNTLESSDGLYKVDI